MGKWKKWLDGFLEAGNSRNQLENMKRKRATKEASL